MMFGMTANQIGQSTHADWSVVSRPAARPRRRVQVAKQLDGGAANDFKLAGKVSHRDVRMIGMFGPDILIKTGKDRTVISGKDKSAIRAGPPAAACGRPAVALERGSTATMQSQGRSAPWPEPLTHGRCRRFPVFGFRRDQNRTSVASNRR